MIRFSAQYQKQYHMLLLFQRSFFNAASSPLLRPTSRINKPITYNYIRKRELDEIKCIHGDTWLQLLKVYSKQAKYIYKQGWAAFKHDAKTFYHLRKRLKDIHTPLSTLEQKQQKRMRQQLQRLKTLVIIQILPFSGILLLFYVYAYPTSIPSWFTVDTYYQSYQLQCIKNQLEAILYYKVNPLHSEGFSLSQLSLQEIRRLSQLLFGHYQDGVVGYNKVLPHRSRQYLLTPRFSKYLLLKNLNKYFKEDIRRHPELKTLQLQELVLWKYHKIMNGQLLLNYQPIDEANTSVQPKTISGQPPKDK